MNFTCHKISLFWVKGRGINFVEWACKRAVMVNKHDYVVFPVLLATGRNFVTCILMGGDFLGCV